MLHYKIRRLTDKDYSGIPEMLSRLPQWRAGIASSYRLPVDTLQSGAAFLLLEELCREKAGIEQIPEFALSPNGKPYFRELPRLHFNMSHCRDAVMCVISDMPAGCDIEPIPECINEDVMNLIFTREENTAIITSSCPEVMFAQTWTRIEAAAKMLDVPLDSYLLKKWRKKFAGAIFTDKEDTFVYSLVSYSDIMDKL